MYLLNASPCYLFNQRNPYAICIAHVVAWSIILISGTFAQAQAPSAITPSSEAKPAAFDNEQPKYVGTNACVDCHKDQYQSYLETTHSRSFHRIGDPGVLCSDSFSFAHGSSGTKYQVLHKDDSLRHRESLMLDDKEIASVDYPMAYAVGSGAHAQTFLFEARGNFGESPLTWYRSRDGHWGMSPGYDQANHLSFNRTVDEDCLHCHVGGVERAGGPEDKIVFTELTIGCERCHGPGSEHVRQRDTKGPDLVNEIINPKKLSRERSESICQQCHMQGAITVTQAGMSLWDFRPGELITDNRSVYQYKSEVDKSRIVGHVEQMHASECYIQSETLTCSTCHDPHGHSANKPSAEVYRKACFQCHDNQSCGIDIPQREAKSGNDCTVCHMPQVQSDVSHVALHHHRIGIHVDEPKSTFDDAERAQLVSILDESSLSKEESVRRRALGTYRLYLQGSLGSHSLEAREKTIRVMFNLYQNGIKEPALMATLAWDALGEGYSDIASQLATEAMQHPSCSLKTRQDALRTLAKVAFDAREHELALSRYRELTKVSQQVNDIYNLGLSEQNVGNSAEAIEALNLTLKMDPTFVSAHEALRAIYASHGKMELAKQQTAAIETIDRFLQMKENSRNE